MPSMNTFEIEPSFSVRPPLLLVFAAILGILFFAAHPLSYIRTTSHYVLLPGQSLLLQNSTVDDLIIRSDYPIDVQEGNCEFNHQADIHLTCEPSPITITDDRPRLLIWSRINNVSVTVPVF